MAALAMDIRSICYYEVLVENVAMNAAGYLKFLKGLIDHWHNNRKYAVWHYLMTMPDLLVMAQLLPGLS